MWKRWHDKCALLSVCHDVHCHIVTSLTNIILCGLPLQIQSVAKASLESEGMSVKVTSALSPCRSSNLDILMLWKTKCVFLSCFSTECQMWMSVKCLLDSVSMGSASTHQAPFSANALQEWLLMSVAGHALVCTAHVLVPIPSQCPVCWCISLQRASWYVPLIFKKK